MFAPASQSHFYNLTFYYDAEDAKRAAEYGREKRMSVGLKNKLGGGLLSRKFNGPLTNLQAQSTKTSSF